MPSHAPMCERKLFPKPCPSEAPFTSPAMSITCKKAGTLLEIRISNYNRQDKYRTIARSKLEVSGQV